MSGHAAYWELTDWVELLLGYRAGRILVGINREEDILIKARRRLTVLSATFVMVLNVLNGQLVQAQDKNKLRIGFSIEDMKGERWQTDVNSFEVRAKAS